jgi:hypothetical protein
MNINAVLGAPLGYTGVTQERGSEVVRKCKTHETCMNID